jgi:hypothetical protein
MRMTPSYIGHHDLNIARGILKDAIEHLYEFYAARGLELNMLKT